MNPAHRISVLEAEIKALKLAAESKAREDQHWHRKYLQMKEDKESPMPQTITCSNCGVTFDHVTRPHHTYYEDTAGEDVGVSCFPLCEDCWSTLTPETRAPFYWRHVLDAMLEQAEAMAIMKAVQDGK